MQIYYEPLKLLGIEFFRYVAVGIQNTMDYGGNSFQLFSFQTHGLNIRDRAKTGYSGCVPRNSGG